MFLTLSVNAQGYFISEIYQSKENNFGTRVWEFEQDTSLILYLGNTYGVTTFNGRDWENFHVGENGRVTAFYKDSSGEIYVSGQTDYGKISIDSLNKREFNSLFSIFNYENDQINQHHSLISDGISLFGFGNLGVDKIHNDSLFSYSLDQPAFGPSAIVGNSVYFFSNEGVFTFNDSLQFIENSEFLSGSQMTTTLNITESDILISSVKKGLISFNGLNFEQIESPIESYLSENFVYASTLINDSTIVFGTLDGGLLYTNLEFNNSTIVDINNGLPSNEVYEVFSDHENSLWVGSEKYVLKVLADIPIQYYKEGEILSDVVFDVEQINNDIIIRFLNGDIVSLNPFTAKINNWNNSTIDIRRVGEELLSFSDNFIIDEITSDTLYKGRILSSIYSHQFSLPKALTNEGIIQIRSVGFNIEIPLDSNQKYNHGIEKDSIYIFHNYTKLDILNDKSLLPLEIEIDSSSTINFNYSGFINGDIFLAAEGGGDNGGLYKFDEVSQSFKKDSVFTQFDSELGNKQIITFEQCDNGDIWFQNNKQIKRLKKTPTGYELRRSPYQLIGSGEAIYDIECADNGTVWFGGVEGLYHLTDPDWEYTAEFKTNITGIFVDNDSLIYGGFGEPVNDIILPYEDNELRFTYAAASYIDETRNTYSVKLEGFDDTWSDWSLETQKDYTNIPEGDYIFKVRSRNVFEADGIEDQILFSVLPPWYRTWWAYMLYLIGFGGLAYSGHRIRVNQLLKLERMRTKIASDLHDEVSATLTGITYFAEAVKTDPDQQKKTHFVNLISESAGDAKEKITDIVWSITPENDDWELFLTKCRRYASDLLESKDLNYELKIAESIPGKLNMNMRQHLWMIFKETLTNAVRHSGATRLDVIMDVEEGVFKMIIQDNGEGFDISTKKFGNGLNNIRKRAEHIKAHLELDSETGMGTRWRLELKL